MCMLHKFAILFTVIWLFNFEAVGADENCSKSSWILGGGRGGLSGSRQNQFQLESLKSKEAVSYLQNYVTASLQGLAPGYGLNAKQWISRYGTNTFREFGEKKLEQLFSKYEEKSSSLL